MHFMGRFRYHRQCALRDISLQMVADLTKPLGAPLAGENKRWHYYSFRFPEGDGRKLIQD